MTFFKKWSAQSYILEPKRRKTMQSKTWGLVLFALGVFSMHVYTTASFLWALMGIPLAYPSVPPSIWGYSVPIGAVLMVIGGLVYGKKAKEVIK